LFLLKGERILKKICPFIFQLLVVLCLSTAVIIFAVFFTLKFSPLYKFDINYLNIEESSTLNKSQLMNNYTTIIYFLDNPSVPTLKLPDLMMSAEAELHFREVRDILITLKYILYCCIFISAILLIYLYKERRFKFYKYTSLSLTIIPLLLAIPFLINFDKSFVIFHKLFFKNGYWEFDPVLDPVINTLPQEFFFHCALLILIVMLLFSGVFAMIYKKSNK